MKNNKLTRPKQYDEETTIKGFHKVKSEDIEKLDIENLDLETLNTEDFLESTHLLVKEFVSTKQQILSDERKMQTIGSALISQKRQLDDIRSAQKQHLGKTDEGLVDISHRQEQVSDEVSKIITATKDIEDLQKEQTELIETLSDFQESYSQMTYQTKIESEESISKLESINSIIDLLSNEVQDMNLQERVAGLTDGIQAVHSTLLDIKDEQVESSETNRQDMDELVRQVVSFRKEVSDKELVQKLYYIQQSADTSDQKIMDLNFKIDMLIEKYELSKDEEDIKLEDLFDEEYVQKTEITQEVDVVEIEEQTDELDDKPEATESLVVEDTIVDDQTESDKKTKDDNDEYVEFSFGEETPAKEGKETPIVFGHQETDNEVNQEEETTTSEKESSNLSRKETQKKTGFFDKLFGGR